jgi:hypothetical protein
MFGNITIKGVAKEVNFPFTAKAQNGGYLFEGTFKLNRRDFGVAGVVFLFQTTLPLLFPLLPRPIRLTPCLNFLLFCYFRLMHPLVKIFFTGLLISFLGSLRWGL